MLKNVNKYLYKLDIFRDKISKTHADKTEIDREGKRERERGREGGREGGREFEDGRHEGCESSESQVEIILVCFVIVTVGIFITTVDDDADGAEDREDDGEDGGEDGGEGSAAHAREKTVFVHVTGEFWAGFRCQGACCRVGNEETCTCCGKDVAGGGGRDA